MPRIRTQPRAFTLLELILVMAMLCMVMGLVAASMRGFSNSSKFQDAAVQIVAVAQYARTQAVTEGRVYRLNLDPQGGSYWLTAQQQETFTAPIGEFNQSYSIPNGTRMAVQFQTQGNKNTIDFYPNGRSDVARITLTDTSGREIQVGNLSPAELFQVLENPQGVRG